MNKSPTQRVEALTDGVFAIVMTLLVLELSIPVISGTSAGILITHRLVEMWPKYLSYVVSFLVLGLWWLYHHGVFDNIKQIDGRLLYYNLFFLMFVSLVPFSASLVATYWREEASALIYGINMLLCFLQLNAISSYAAKRHLIAVEPDPAYIKGERKAQIRILLLIAFAILISFINSVISLLLWGLMSGFYIMAILVNREGLQARKTKS